MARCCLGRSCPDNRAIRLPKERRRNKFLGKRVDQGEAADQQHGVARVSLIGGDVNLQRNGSAEMVAAVVNAPLLSQDRLQSAPGSSAEVQIGGSTIVRMAQNTDLGFADLQSGRAQLQFGAGTMIFRVLRETQLQTDIETPSIAVHPLGPADIRISVLENGSTQVTVRAGAADIYGPGGTQRLEAQRSVLVRVNASGPEFQETSPPAHDGLDDWSAGRDHELLASASYQYTGGDMAGAGDLDANGAWVGSQYGPVWTPRAPDPEWAPYSNGQWVNEPYYGWTWVDAEPWGWAPFHYGRWFWNGGRGWCWWPGAVGFRHAWGPAFVGFLGFGGGGGLGWVALAPYEGFHAWWGRGGYRGYGGFYPERGRMFGGYQNAVFRGGAVGGSFAAFGGFRGRFNAISRETLAGATPIRGQLPVSGSAYRFQFVNRQAVPNPRLASVSNRTYFQTPRSSFQASRSGYAGSRPSAASSGFRPASQYRTPTASAGQSAGWQHFGDPRMPGNSRQGFTSGQGESGWHQFGQPERPPDIRSTAVSRIFQSAVFVPAASAVVSGATRAGLPVIPRIQRWRRWRWRAESRWRAGASKPTELTRGRRRTFSFQWRVWFRPSPVALLEVYGQTRS